MPTPRTDAIAHAGHNESVYIARMTYLARELERELADARAWSSRLADFADDTRAELAAERALADRLAETLKQSTNHLADHMPCEESCQCTRRRIVRANEQALAAWKEARREAQ